MKIVLSVLMAIILSLSSCTSLERVLNTAIDEDAVTIAEKITEDVTFGDVTKEAGAAETESDTAAAGPETAEPEVTEPETILPTREEVIAAVESSDLDGLTEMLEGVEDVNAIIGDDVPILVMAEEAAGINGYENPVTRLLVEKGAYILQRDERGRDFEKVIQEFELAATPRHEFILNTVGDKKKRYWAALRSDSVDEVKALLEYLPVDSNLLLDAAHQKSEEIVKWALSEGVSVNSKNSKDATVLHLACDGYTHKSFEERTALVGLVLDAGADATALDYKNRTPLLYVMEASKNTKGSMKDIIELLLEHGADPDDADSSGNTILKTAVIKNQTDTVLLLLEKGASPELPDSAVLNMKPDMIRTFVGYGADPSLFTSAINIADAGEQSELVHFLIDAGASAEKFELIRVRDNIPLLEYLVENGADINSGNLLNSYAVHFAGVEVLEYLVEHGADLNKKFYNDRTVLHSSVMNKNLEAARFFVEHGTKINEVDKKNKTALDYCKKTDSELYAYLVEAGAKSGSEL